MMTLMLILKLQKFAHICENVGDFIQRNRISTPNQARILIVRLPFKKLQFFFFMLLLFDRHFTFLRDFFK